MSDAILRKIRPTQLRELILVLVIIGLIIFFATQVDGYLTGRTFNRITTTFPIIAIVAVGQVLVVLTRNIDLSVGSQVGLVALTLGTIMRDLGNTPGFVQDLFALSGLEGDRAAQRQHARLCHDVLAFLVEINGIG